MKTAITKLLAIVAFLALLAGAIGSTTHEGWLTAWFLLFIFVGLPILILAGFYPVFADGLETSKSF